MKPQHLEFINNMESFGKVIKAVFYLEDGKPIYFAKEVDDDMLNLSLEEVYSSMEQEILKQIKVKMEK